MDGLFLFATKDTKMVESRISCRWCVSRLPQVACFTGMTLHSGEMQLRFFRLEVGRPETGGDCKWLRHSFRPAGSSQTLK